MSRLSEVDIANDSKYKQYTLNVEKVLKTFEYTNEWADLIAALAKLYKIILNNSKFGRIPKAVLVSKRLSQCMHPALPFGVHMKAIECYRQIFDTLGTAHLAADVHLYSVGLFPLLANATINVKRALLDLYETYFLPIGADLRPSLTGILNGVLPALEEGSEFFERIYSLLLNLETSVSSTYFFACLWRCVTSTSSVRSAALFYSTCAFERKRHSVDEQVQIKAGADVDLMVSALIECASNETSSNLVQRQLLDFLINVLPLNCANVESSSGLLLYTDFKAVFKAALFVLLRRDQSLNRRLFSWMFGIAKENIEQIDLVQKRRAYFDEHCRTLFVSSMLDLIDDDDSLLDFEFAIKLCRLFSYLFDRLELQNCIVNDLLLSFLTRFYTMDKKLSELPIVPNPNSIQPTATDDKRAKTFDESMKSLNLLFSNQKAKFLWTFLTEMCQEMQTKGGTSRDFNHLCQLLRFLLKYNQQQIMHHLAIDEENVGRMLNLLFRLPQYDQFGETDFNDAIDLVNVMLEVVDSAQLFPKTERPNSPVESSFSASNNHPAYNLKFRMAALHFFHSVVDKSHSADLCITLCKFVQKVSQYPVYRYLEENSVVESSKSDSNWLDALCKLCLSAHLDLASQAAEIFLKVLLQSEIILRETSDASAKARLLLDKPDSKVETILLTPLLNRDDIKRLYLNGYFLKLPKYFWTNIRSDCNTPGLENNCLNVAQSQQACAKVLHLSHCVLDRRFGDPVENIILADMTATDNQTMYSAISRFSHCTILWRNLSSETGFLLDGIVDRPFENIHCLMLDINERSDSTVRHLKSRWLEDCLRHEDLVSKRLDALIKRLLDRKTARLAVQSLQVERASTPEETGDLYRLTNAAGSSVYHYTGGEKNWLRVQRDFVFNWHNFTTTKKDALGPFMDQSFSDDVYLQEDIGVVVRDVLSDILDCIDETVSNRSGSLVGATSVSKSSCYEAADEAEESTIPEFSHVTRNHSHLLFYYRRFDIEKVAFGLNQLAYLIEHTVAASLLFDQFLSARLSDAVKVLLLGHQRSIAGYAFNNQKTDEVEIKVTCENYFDCLITIAGYYLRSNFLNNPMLDEPIGRTDVQTNLGLKCASARLLLQLFRQTNQLCCRQQQQGGGDSRRQLALRIRESLVKCRLQRIVVGLLSAIQYDMAYWTGRRHPGASVADVIVRFNIGLCPNPMLNLRTLQTLLLDLLAALLEFEHSVKNVGQLRLNVDGDIQDDPPLQKSQKQRPTSLARYIDTYATVGAEGQPLVNQKSFCALFAKCFDFAFYSHLDFLLCLTRSLPFLDKSLPQLVFNCVRRLRANLELCAALKTGHSNDPLPPNYGCSLLQYFAVLCHYCLLDPSAIAGSSQCLSATTPGSLKSSSSSTNMGINVVVGASEMITSLFRVLTFTQESNSHVSAASKKYEINFVLLARQQVLSMLTDILSTLCDMRGWTVNRADSMRPWFGTPKETLRLVAEFVDPVVVCHQKNFLTSMAFVWSMKGRKAKTASLQENLNSIDCQQEDVAKFLLAVKFSSLDDLLNAVTQTLRNPVKVMCMTDKDQPPIEVSLVELTCCCLQILMSSNESCSAPHLKVTWAVLQKFLGESMSLLQSATAKLCLFKLFADFVEKCSAQKTDGGATDESALASKGLRREVQEVCQTFVDSLLEIVSFQLAQQTWLKRTLMVKESDHLSTSASCNELNMDVSDEKSLSGSLSLLSHDPNNNNSKRDILSSVCALNLIAERLPQLFDMIYKSEEKEKLQLAASQVWAVVCPFLKCRTRKNGQNLQACAQLLCRLSQYPLVRPVWRKSVLDLLCDAHFLNMDVDSARHCMVTVDNLMSQDRNSFREFMSRSSTAQSGGLFTGKEQEYEQRCHSIKRLSFVLLSSELDQYQQNLPEIQEKITDNLRLSNAHHLFAQVLVCLRVLLIRLSATHLIPVWPTVVTELVTVMSMMDEDAISSASSQHQEAKNTIRDDRLFNLYLCACKLLESLRLLPSEKLAQFQMYSWIFFPPISSPSTGTTTGYVDFSTKILRSIEKASTKSSRLDDPTTPSSLIMEDIKALPSLKSLAPFFRQLCSRKRIAYSTPPTATVTGDSKTVAKLVERSILVDLLDNLL